MNQSNAQSCELCCYVGKALVSKSTWQVIYICFYIVGDSDKIGSHIVARDVIIKLDLFHQSFRDGVSHSNSQLTYARFALVTCLDKQILRLRKVTMVFI